MAAVAELVPDVSIRAACNTLKLPRTSYYRQKQSVLLPMIAISRPLPARALRPEERKEVLAHLHGDASRIAPQPLFMRRCSMRASICAPFAPCIAF